MANGFTSVEVWVLVDDQGEYAIGVDEEQAIERYDEDFQGSASCRRAVKVTLTIPTPKPIEVKGELPEESAAGCELRAE